MTVQNMVTLKSVAAAIVVAAGYEKKRQRALTELPQIYRQITPENDTICSLMTETMKRSIRPSLFVGTRPAINRLVALTKTGPIEAERIHEKIPTGIRNANERKRELEIVWELPHQDSEQRNLKRERQQTRDFLAIKNTLLSGPIQYPVVLIMHCASANTSSGYIRSLMNQCTRNGWVAAAINYNYGIREDAQTKQWVKDLRYVIDIISKRLALGVPLFLVGFSIGANAIVQYLGEEGKNETTKSCIAGAVSFSNPIDFGTHDEDKNGKQDVLRNKLFLSCIGVPLLKIVSLDDDAVYQQTIEALNNCLVNPNIIVAKTKSGGHIGYHHSPLSLFGRDHISWADAAASRFIKAILKTTFQRRCYVQNQDLLKKPIHSRL